MKRSIALFALLISIAPAFADAPKPNDYTDAANWLCRPGRADPCSSADESATIVSADGTLTRESWQADPNAPIDCFYVYPTVSFEPTANSDMIPGPGEISVVRDQVERLAGKCKIYAPMYRQVTLTALGAAMAGKPMTPDRALAYNDVADAWHEYLAHDNHGRGVVLIGHSQGSGVLTALIKNEIDGKPVQKQIVSAILGGTRLQVPPGKDVGGDFQHMALCRAAGDTGCVIAFASYRATVPPDDKSFFIVGNNGTVTACVNPAALGGGAGALKAYLPTGKVGLSQEAPVQWVTPPKPIDTQFVSVPGLLSGECVSTPKGSYLAVTIHADPKDPRADDIIGDVVIDGKVQPDWGLHLIDMNLTAGNLVDVVDAQSKAWRAAH
jgi:hypothetical protein